MGLLDNVLCFTRKREPKRKTKRQEDGDAKLFHLALIRNAGLVFIISPEDSGNTAVFINVIIGLEEPLWGGLGTIKIIVPRLYYEMPEKVIENFAKGELVAFYNRRKPHA